MTPKRRGYKMCCCDCGLVHRMDFRVVEDQCARERIQFRVYRDTAATEEERMRKSTSELEAQKEEWHGLNSFLQKVVDSKGEKSIIIRDGGSGKS